MGAFVRLVLGMLLVANIRATRQYPGKVRMCYFNNQAQDRPGRGRFVPGNIDDSLCTHLVYGYAHVTANGTSIETTHSNDYDFFSQIMNMKNWKPSLKVLLSVGGPADHTETQNEAFTAMVSRNTERTAFISNVIAFLRLYGFDGMDVNWQYPLPTYRVQFENFIKALREAIIQEAHETRQEMLMMTVAAWGRHDKMLHSYDPSRLAQYVDFFLLHTYDLWDTSMRRLGHHTALTSGLGVPSVNKTVSSWLAAVHGGKIVLGLATFGKTARLADPSHHNLGDNFTQSPASPGFYTRDRRSLAYFEVCENLKTIGTAWTSVYVPAGALAYSTQPTYDWVCYDDKASFRIKASFALQHGLAGVFFSSMDLDDFSGEFCLQGRYPLLREAQVVFDAFVPPSTTTTTTTTTTPPTTSTSTTTQPTTTTTTPTTTTTSTTTTTTAQSTTTANAAPPTTPARDCKPFKCPNAPSSGNPDFLYPDPFDCHKYYQCVMPGIMSMYYSMQCPAELVFDPTSLRCEYSGDSPCVPCPEVAGGEAGGKRVWG